MLYQCCKKNLYLPQQVTNNVTNKPAIKYQNMARIKYSALIAGVSGKLNGSVFAKNRGGDYVRNKSTVRNPKTTPQVNQRSKFSFLSKLWRTLDQVQRDAWSLAATFKPYQDPFGDARFLSGNAYFQKVNLNLATVGTPALASPLADETLNAITDLRVGISMVNNAIDVTVQADLDGPLNPNQALVLKAAVVNSAGINYAANLFKQIIIIDPPAAGAINITSSLEDIFGTLRTGQKIFVRGSLTQVVTGQTSLGVEDSDVIPA